MNTFNPALYRSEIAFGETSREMLSREANNTVSHLINDAELVPERWNRFVEVTTDFANPNAPDIQAIETYSVTSRIITDTTALVAIRNGRRNAQGQLSVLDRRGITSYWDADENDEFKRAALGRITDQGFFGTRVNAVSSAKPLQGTDFGDKKVTAIEVTKPLLGQGVTESSRLTDWMLRISVLDPREGMKRIPLFRGSRPSGFALRQCITLTPDGIKLASSDEIEDEEEAVKTTRESLIIASLDVARR